MLLSLLTRYLRRYWPFLAGVLVFQFVSALAALFLPTLNASLIDEGVANGDVPYILRTGGWMLVVAFGQILAAIVATFCAARAAMSIGRDLRRDIFSRVSAFSEREVSQFGAGSLITRNTNDVQQVQMLAMMSATMLVMAPMMSIGGIIMAVRQDIGLSWILAVSIPVLLIGVAIVISRMVPLFRSYQSRIDTVNRVLREQLTGVRVVRAFVRESIEEQRFRVANTDIMDIGRRVGSLFVLVFPLVLLIMNVTIAGVVWFGGIEVDAGNTQVGTLFAFMQYVGQILGGVMMASFVAMMIPRAAVSAERISAVLASETTLVPPAEPITVMPRPGEVTFDNAEFIYPGAEQPVLSGISFRADPGETVAIIGSTGSGKSTLVSLIPRLFDATSGTVQVHGVDVTQADLSVLWRGIGLVPQRPFLFAGTVASNLRFAKEDATDEELWHALEIAQAADFVRERTGGLDSEISQGGTNVSGGQRQRLAIARAVVRRPEVLVFDDSFSALDLTTDARLRQALWRELPDVTKIVVAQRVSTITDADRIVVLEDGRMAGVGTHDELLEISRTYREILDSQKGVDA
ncbi:ABC transporter ATP-binding protein [Microbacterium amylolyticum]|uniref:ATP-binding cassette subfamily B protein n=1 Tax=Microbacterium amylolyticum TaxID=936337 RepID=A0ABS4ZHC0_9MICO|nr:ABC transporter ATP-binding protein [Microbacterium amylolyticum]MBP2436670.1 ATP-binding cassette subfamily B protein [Microbacterium amylolyticum]